MARPAYKPNDIRAIYQLERTFWNMLAREPYQKLSVRSLVSESGLNKNTFYYHFKNLDDLASHAVAEVLAHELAEEMLAATLSRDFVGIALRTLAQPSMQERFARMALVLSPHGDALREIVEHELVAIWANLLDVPQDNQDRMLILRFVAGGLVSAMKNRGAAPMASVIEGLLSSPAIEHCVGELREWRSPEAPVGTSHTNGPRLEKPGPQEREAVEVPRGWGPAGGPAPTGEGGCVCRCAFSGWTPGGEPGVPGEGGVSVSLETR